MERTISTAVWATIAVIAAALLIVAVQRQIGGIRPFEAQAPEEKGIFDACPNETLVCVGAGAQAETKRACEARGTIACEGPCPCEGG